MKIYGRRRGGREDEQGKREESKRWVKIRRGEPADAITSPHVVTSSLLVSLSLFSSSASLPRSFSPSFFSLTLLLFLSLALVLCRLYHSCPIQLSCELCLHAFLCSDSELSACFFLLLLWLLLSVACVSVVAPLSSSFWHGSKQRGCGCATPAGRNAHRHCVHFRDSRHRSVALNSLPSSPLSALPLLSSFSISIRFHYTHQVQQFSHCYWDPALCSAILERERRLFCLRIIRAARLRCLCHLLLFSLLSSAFFFPLLHLLTRLASLFLFTITTNHCMYLFFPLQDMQPWTMPTAPNPVRSVNAWVRPA